MIKFKFILALLLGVQCTPNLFSQYINKAIYFDSISAELPYGLVNFNNKDAILGSTLDFSNKSYPFLLLENDSFKNFKTFLYKSNCPIFEPVRTNQLGQQNGHYYFLANCNPSYNKFEIYKILIDSLGDTVSTYRINNNDTSLALRAHFLPNGDMVLLGQNPSEYFVQKWKDDSLLWTYQSDVNSPIILHNILIDGDDIVVSGRIGIFNNNPGSDLFVAKFNSNGQLLWDLRKDFGESEVMGGLTKFNSEYVISFTKAPWINWPNHDLNTYLGIFDINGKWISSKLVGKEGRSKVTNNILLVSGNNLLFFVGEHNIEDNNRESVIFSLNKNIEVQWERHYYYEDSQKLQSNIWDARIEPDSTIKTIGVLYNGPGGQDLWYLHLDKHGCLTPGCEVNDVTVEEVFLGEEEKLVVYPNPFSETLKIKSVNSIEEIQIFDVFGKLVFNESKPRKTINLEDLPKGFYLLKAKMVNGGLITKKIIKQ